MTHSAQTYDVIGIGRAYIDVIAPASHDLLKKYDIPLGTGRYFDVPGINQVKSELPDPTYFPGGTIPNTLSGLAAMGGNIGYFGKIADDAAGNVFLEDLKARKINHLCPGYVAEAPLSGTCIVLLTDDGERSFALHKGCVDQYADEDFKNFDFGSTKYLLVAANLLSNASTFEVIAQAVRQAAETKCKIVLSLSEVRNWEERAAMAHEIVARHADVLIGNEEEMSSLFKVTGELSGPQYTVVTTRGARGASARRGGEERHIPALQTEHFVSSLGAGDQFLAGFLKGEVMGLPLEGSLQLAIRCADAIIRQTEARPLVGADWSPLIDQVKTLAA